MCSYAWQGMNGHIHTAYSIRQFLFKDSGRITLVLGLPVWGILAQLNGYNKLETVI